MRSVRVDERPSATVGELHCPRCGYRRIGVIATSACPRCGAAGLAVEAWRPFTRGSRVEAAPDERRRRP